MTTNEDEEKITLKKSGFLWRASYGGIAGQGKTTGRAYFNLVKRLYAHMQGIDEAWEGAKQDAMKAKKELSQIKEKLEATQKAADSIHVELFHMQARKTQAEASIEHVNNLRIENCRLIGENRILAKQIEELTQRTTS